MISPLLGYNNNVRHRGHVFHIQTEDSGIKYPHVITHLFADGGRILKTIKTSYSEHLESERLSDIIRDLMKQQHKAMFVALRDGRFDQLVGLDSSGTPSESANEEPSSPPASIEAEPEGSSSPPRTPPQRAQAPDLFASFSSKEQLDIETIEHVARSAQADSAPIEPGAAVDLEDSKRTPSGRYAQTRPASIFSASSTGGSIFGEELISEQSLDEVILGYLAEDIGDTEPP